MIAPAPRAGRPAPVPREVVAEVASLLATGYLRLRARAQGEVREIEASAHGELSDTGRQSLSPVPVEPSCAGPAENPPARSTT